MAAKFSQAARPDDRGPGTEPTLEHDTDGHAHPTPVLDGIPRSVLLIGGEVALARALLRAFVRAGTRTVVLAAERPRALDSFATRLRAMGATTVETAPFDPVDHDAHARFVDAVFERYDAFDLVLVAPEVEPGAQAPPADPVTAVADPPGDPLADADGMLRLLDRDLVGAVSVLLPASRRLAVRGGGALVVLAPVRDEATFGLIGDAVGAGLDAVCRRLGRQLDGSGVQVLLASAARRAGRQQHGAADTEEEAAALAASIMDRVRRRSGRKGRWPAALGRLLRRR
jgi:NAD(P)-dependent dehydrogenase (short-subunit alcohol dehydrogenase family)